MTLPLRRVGMATPGNLSEEQVHCSICLDVFTNPVSIPCGHNFCQSCILGYWKTSPLYQCPMCKKSFHKRPDIGVNTVLREIAEQFKQIRVKSTDGKGNQEEGALLKKTEIDVQQMIQDRVKKVDEIKHSLELNKVSAQKEIEESMQVFSELVRSIQKAQAELVLVIEEKQRQTERWAEGLISELEQEISELKTRHTDLENVSRTDHINFLKDRHQVRHLGAWQELPDHPHRFDTVVIVLGRDGFTSGRHYWEVQVGDKDDWYLGVAKSTVKRKGRISVSTAQGYWALAMKKGQGYRVSTSPPVLLSFGPKPKRIGVYVDYEEGQVSFYDVKARTHIYTFEDTFTEKILPFFYLYCCDKASDTMAICPVQEKSLIK
ncbi:hypothetical protein GOODEAATRI_012988 [Goodea atripinnis]|uniref:Uncharacterized protein n=1 Tax=Goodea atripinnis TaxID=208336 RepID=A0ABV0N0X8_9TELE